MVVEETADLLAADLLLRYDPAQFRVVGVRPAASTAGFLLASRASAGELRIALAGAQAGTTGAGALVEIELESLTGADPQGAVELREAVLNNGRIQALLPGQKATFANYTSYSKGLNGIMVDIAGLAGTPSTADFQFRYGNVADSGTWTAWTGRGTRRYWTSWAISGPRCDGTATPSRRPKGRWSEARWTYPRPPTSSR